MINTLGVSDTKEDILYSFAYNKLLFKIFILLLIID